MINPEPIDIGRHVIYHKGLKDEESGIITSMNDSYVFVRYNFVLGEEGTSQSTRREDLEWNDG